jgi:tetratricopeptide (TPR) repeat protein
MKVYRLFFLLSICSLAALAQQKEMKKKISPKYENSKSSYFQSRSAESIENRIAKAERLKDSDPAGAVDILEETLSESIQSGDRYNEAESYRVLAVIHELRNLRESAVQNAHKALNLFTALKDEDKIQQLNLLLANNYKALSNYAKATAFYNQYYQWAVKNKLDSEAGKALMGLGFVYKAQNNKTEAIAKFESALKFLDKEKDGNEIAEVNQELGELYENTQQKTRALEYYSNANEAALENKSTDILIKSNFNISNVLRSEGKYLEELELHQRQLASSIEKNDIENQSRENLAIGNVYLELQQPQEAIPYLIQSITQAEQSNILENKSEALKSLSKAYQKQKAFEKSIKAFENYVLIKDSLIAKKEKQLSQQLTVNLSLTEKQKRIDLLEKDVELLTSEQLAREARLRTQRVVIYSLLIGLVVIGLSSWLVYKNAQKRRIANQLLALKSLRSQMNPHFIFNALNSVNSFISRNDEKSANKYLADFARLMRMVMENSQHDFVTLTGEIQLLQLYLSLEHFRFKEKFEYEFVVDESIDTDKFLLPPMLIQPCIENAIWHGLRYKEQKGFLRVAISESKNVIEVLIEDNGIGRKKSTELKTQHQKTTVSTGIRNTEGRINLIRDVFGKKIEMNIQDAFPEAEDKGTRVRIHISA